MLEEMKVSIIKWDVDWLGIKKQCCETIPITDDTKDPSRDWKRRVLVAEYSPLSNGLITIQIDNIPFYIAEQLTKDYKGLIKGKQTDIVSIIMDLNIQSLIDISRKNLCHQADINIIKVWRDIIIQIAKYDQDIAWACVPEGIRTCGCTKTFGGCSVCENIISTLDFYKRLDMLDRYDHYNNFRNTILKKELVKCNPI